jgi:hypothetical protein
MSGTSLKISLMLAVAAVGVPHALCAGHPNAVAGVVHQDHAATVCEHCTGRSGQPTSDPSRDDQCPHCEVSDQPYVPSAEVKLAETAHPLTDWVLLSVPLATSVVDPAARASSAESVPISNASVSGRALTILLAHLLL